MKYSGAPEALRLHAIGDDAGRTLNILVIALQCKHVLELGTGFGYGTVWLAHAIRETGGVLTCVDHSADKLCNAKALAGSFTLRDEARFVCADAVEFIQSTADPSWDMVVLDVDKTAYAACISALMVRISRRCVVLADNLLSHRVETQAFIQCLDQAGVMHVLLPVGKGLELCLLLPSSGSK